MLHSHTPGLNRMRRRAAAVDLLRLCAGALACILLLGCEDGPVIPLPVEAEPDPLAEGQQKIDEGDYEGAVDIFTQAMEADPSQVDAYRGRAEAKLLLGQYAGAYHDMFALSIGTVQPENVDDMSAAIVGSYVSRLEADPENVPALTGRAFAAWSFWSYSDALEPLDKLLEMDPDNVYANLFRGSNRLFAGVEVDAAVADMERALELSPDSPDVRFVVADAYTYALPDPPRAYEEAQTALSLGLDTPRIHAILSASLVEAGDLDSAAYHLDQHITQVTREYVSTAPLEVGSSMTLDLVPWQTFRIPIDLNVEEQIVIGTGSDSTQVWDSILVLLGPDGTPVIGNDDFDGFYAGLDWMAPEAGRYTIRVTSFEGINTGPLVVTRK